jgi:hypothetical protein
MKKSWLSSFLIYFIAAASLYGVFLYCRGFGWDGDSLISATQFVKLVNPSIYGLYDGGAQPKLLTILLFGAVYQLTHDFVYLTFLAIFLNAFMVAVLCCWVRALNGAWWIAFLGFSINIYWYQIVINCDNPAFSIPFAFIGLYLYFHLQREIAGVILLLASSLFRPGAEIILLSILFLRLIKRDKANKETLLVILASIIGVLHSLYGYLLAYPTKEAFLSATVTFFPEASSQIARFRHSPLVLLVYLKTVILQATKPNIMLFLPFAVIGTFNIFRKNISIKYLGMGILSTLIQPAGAFVYGVVINIQVDKIMEYTFLYPAFAAFALQHSSPILHFTKNQLVNYVLVALLSLCVVLFIIFSGLSLEGKYEVNPNGTGVIPWRQLTIEDFDRNGVVPTPHHFNALIPRSDVIFFVLDYGMRAKNIRFIDELSSDELEYRGFDIVVRPHR